MVYNKIVGVEICIMPWSKLNKGGLYNIQNVKDPGPWSNQAGKGGGVIPDYVHNPVSWSR